MSVKPGIIYCPVTSLMVASAGYRNSPFVPTATIAPSLIATTALGRDSPPRAVDQRSAFQDDEVIASKGGRCRRVPGYEEAGK